MNVEYKAAMSEALCIINQSDNKYKSKIPQSFMKFLKENADSTYKPQFDIAIPIKELNLKKETKGILALIYQSYICSDEEKIKYNNILKQNSEKMQKELSEKYDIYKIFDEKKKNAIAVEEEFDNSPKDMIEYNKETIFGKIIKFIKSFFKRR